MKMTRRIFKAIMISVISSLVIGTAMAALITYHNYDGAIQNSLHAQLQLASSEVESSEDLPLSSFRSKDFRFTLIGPDGSVLYDSVADASTMESHSTREEFIEAQKSGIGKSERYSSTLSEKTIYEAKLLSNGSVLRISTNQKTVANLFLQSFEPLLIMLFIVILLSFFLARRLSQAIVGPINRIDLAAPLADEAYDEIAPLISRIRDQNSQIASQIKTLQQRQDEFNLIADNMEEGLVLLDRDKSIISINRAAERLFHVSGNIRGENILNLNRSLQMQALIEKASQASHCEQKIEIDSKVYQMDASPICFGGKVSGTAILILDITQKSLAEKIRREFSANVSHELKTPLQTISGSAELLENGLVKDMDKPLFYARIRAEAARLISLVNDIIQISQLDENTPMAFEDTDLLDIAQSSARSLEQHAARNGISIRVQGIHASIHGVKHLLEQLTFNLMDNAIRYNKPDGSVTVTVSDSDGKIMLEVKDTGIGIPKEDQNRVFERFYRVDKSHFRETGGTGLGLSIVKHAAEYHHASISLSSTLGKGTAITVEFPKSI
ncbi:MAG: ATP-binding protein [Sphaerochaetaceae bacterium]|nr:ATP-binding protein [Sphaerochaetaceae bacterium]